MGENMDSGIRISAYYVKQCQTVLLSYAIRGCTWTLIRWGYNAGNLGGIIRQVIVIDAKFAILIKNLQCCRATQAFGIVVELVCFNHKP